MSEFIKKLENIFTKRLFFIRIYEISDQIIFWNDKDIKKKIDKKKLENYLVKKGIKCITPTSDDAKVNNKKQKDGWQLDSSIFLSNNS